MKLNKCNLSRIVLLIFISVLSFSAFSNEIIRYKQRGSLHSNGGGFVSNTASVDPTVFVGKKAAILDYAIVRGNVRVTGYARVRGNAELFGNVEVSGFSRVSGYARLRNNVKVNELAQVSGSAYLKDSVEVSGFSKVSGQVEAYGNVRFFALSRVSGKAVFSDMVWVSSEAFIAPKERTVYSGREWITGFSILERFEVLKEKLKCYL